MDLTKGGEKCQIDILRLQKLSRCDIIFAMAQRFFTADFHLGSHATNVRMRRPFKDVEAMNRGIINVVNQRAPSRSDIVVHIGDFCQYGIDRHYADPEIQRGLKVKPSSYIDSFKCTLILVEGNHDRTNRVKAACRAMKTNVGSFPNVTVGHYPTNDPNAVGTFLDCRGHNMGIHLCGHVHDAWRHLYDTEHNILNINCGLDAWNFVPLSESKLDGYIGSIIARRGLPYRKPNH